MTTPNEISVVAPKTPTIGPTNPINVAFWNLQNLFDTDASPIAVDLEFTPVNGWDRRAFEARINNLAEIIRLMFDGQGPDLLGVCEIENAHVARILIDAIGRDDYELAHVDQPQILGIGTSLIYSKRLFDCDLSTTRGHLVHLRYPTRDIFEVHLRVRQNNSELVVLVNHWPSRSSGRLETESFRMTVAAHCRRIITEKVKLPRKDYLELSDCEASLHLLNRAWDRNVLVMGDLNDEPWDRSVLDQLGAGFSVDHLEETIRFSRGNLPSYRAYAGKSAWLFNPMWSLMTDPDQGTHYDSGSTQTMNMLDQFLVSRGLYFGLQGLQLQQVRPGVPHVEVFRPDVMTAKGKGRPREFRKDTRTGYSDHFPITTTLQLVDN